MQGVFCWSSSYDCFKVFNEVCLVRIAKFQNYARPIYHFAGGQAFSYFVESIAFDYPLRTDTDILPEESLHCPFVEVEPVHYIINFGDLSMSDDIVNDFVNEPDMLILLWEPLAKEFFREFYHLSFVFSREDRIFQRFALNAENVPETDGGIRQLRNRRFQKGVKGAGLEFHAKNLPFVFEEARELARLHAVDSRLVFLNDCIDARVRERLLHVRFLPSKIP